MTTLTTTASTVLPEQRGRTRATLLVTAAIAAATALLDLLTRQSPDHLTTAGDYAFTVMLFPFVLGPIAAITMLHRMQDGRDGRLGQAGYLVTVTALAAFIPCGIASLVTGDTQALGPVYVLAMLGSLAGLIVFAIGLVRARVLPRWAGPLLPVAWLAGGPVTEGGSPGFRGAALILAAALTAIAITLPDAEA